MGEEIKQSDIASDEITEKEKLCTYCLQPNKADVSACVHCGYKWEQSKELLIREDKKDAASDFGTLMFIGRLNSFIGWLLVFGSVIAIFIGLSGPGVDKRVSLIGLAAIPISLLVVASGQIISCFVSTERNTKETNGLLRQILDKDVEEKTILKLKEII